MKILVEITAEDVLEWMATNKIKLKACTDKTIDTILAKIAPEIIEDIYRSVFQTIEFRFAVMKKCGHAAKFQPDWTVVDRKVKEFLESESAKCVIK